MTSYPKLPDSARLRMFEVRDGIYDIAWVGDTSWGEFKKANEDGTWSPAIWSDIDNELVVNRIVARNEGAGTILGCWMAVLLD